MTTKNEATVEVVAMGPPEGNDPLEQINRLCTIGPAFASELNRLEELVSGRLVTAKKRDSVVAAIQVLGQCREYLKRIEKAMPIVGGLMEDAGALRPGEIEKLDARAKMSNGERAARLISDSIVDPKLKETLNKIADLLAKGDES